MPRITLGVIVLVVVMYLVGANFPGLASKVGLKFA